MQTAKDRQREEWEQRQNEADNSHAGNGKPPRTEKKEPEKKRSDKPEILTLPQLQLLNLPDPLMFVEEHLVVEGLNLLAGGPKMGKSVLAVGLALDMAINRPVFGRFQVSKPGKILYISLEDGRRRMQKRTRQMLASAGAAASANFELANAWPSLDQDGLAYMLEWVLDKRSQQEEPLLIVIDTYGLLQQQQHTRNSAYHQDYQGLAPVQKMALERQIAVLAILHTGKRGGADPFATMQGTMGVPAASDSMLVFRKEGDACKLYHRGRDFADKTIELKFNDGRWLYAGASDGVLQLGGIAKKIYDQVLKTGLSFTPLQLAEAIGENRSAVRGTLRRMEADRLVECADGRYRLVAVKQQRPASENNGDPSRKSNNETVSTPPADSAEQNCTNADEPSEVPNPDILPFEPAVDDPIMDMPINALNISRIAMEWMRACVRGQTVRDIYNAVDLRHHVSLAAALRSNFNSIGRHADEIQKAIETARKGAAQA